MVMAEVAIATQAHEVSGLTDDAKEVLNTSLASLRARIPFYERYRRYDDGKHDLRYATEKFRNVFGNLIHGFADNLCPVIVEAVNDRLILQRFGITDALQDVSLANIQPNTDATAIWNANRMDQRGAEVQREALLCGDAFIIVWPDEVGQPILYPNRPDLITVEYDEEQPGKLRWASKLWYSKALGRHRCNIYYVDRIEKYMQKSKTKERTLPNSSLDFTELAGVDEDVVVDNPYGLVPVFPFANNSRIGEYGRSELLNVIPLQDALNKSVCDLLVAMEFVALPQRYATGIAVAVDEETGEPTSKPFTPGVDRVWSTPNNDARFGQFEQAKLSEFIAVQQDLRMAIARTSGTPFHYLQIISSIFPTGEGMKTAESRFLAKIHNRQITYGNAWEDVMKFALTVAKKVSPDTLTSIWKDPAPRSEKEFIEIEEVKHRMGVPEEQLWVEMGYSEKRIAEMRALRTQEVEREMSIQENARAKANQMTQTKGQQPREAGKGVTGKTRDEVA